MRRGRTRSPKQTTSFDEWVASVRLRIASDAGPPGAAPRDPRLKAAVQQAASMEERMAATRHRVLAPDPELDSARSLADQTLSRQGTPFHDPPWFCLVPKFVSSASRQNPDLPCCTCLITSKPGSDWLLLPPTFIVQTNSKNSGTRNGTSNLNSIKFSPVSTILPLVKFPGR
jgi:hypothetical protein